MQQETKLKQDLNDNYYMIIEWTSLQIFYLQSINSPPPPSPPPPWNACSVKITYLPLFMENGIEHKANHCIDDTTDI